MFTMRSHIVVSAIITKNWPSLPSYRLAASFGLSMSLIGVHTATTTHSNCLKMVGNPVSSEAGDGTAFPVRNCQCHVMSILISAIMDVEEFS